MMTLNIRLNYYGGYDMKDRKLLSLYEEFTAHMHGRLEEKERQGWFGWDDLDYYSFDIPDRLQEKVNRVINSGEECSTKDLTDIANLAMFLFHKRINNRTQK